MEEWSQHHKGIGVPETKRNHFKINFRSQAIKLADISNGFEISILKKYCNFFFYVKKKINFLKKLGIYSRLFNVSIGT